MIQWGATSQLWQLKLRTMQDATSLWAKIHEYHPEKRQFLRLYVVKLKKVDYECPAEYMECVPARLIVPKKPLDMYRLTTDKWPANNGKCKNMWPIPHIEAVNNEEQRAVYVAIIDCCSSY